MYRLTVNKVYGWSSIFTWSILTIRSMQLILMVMNTHLSTIYHFYIYVYDINNNIYKKMNKNSDGQLF